MSHVKNENKIFDPIGNIEKIDWDFVGADTQFLTHNFHSYPAKFIPQIPRRLIQLFSVKGDIVLDPFCGSGTTLVESRLLGRNSIGNDLNPLACLISKVKVTPIPYRVLKTLEDLITSIERDINVQYGQLRLDKPLKPQLDSDVRKFPRVNYWFKKHVQRELAIIKKHIDGITNQDLRDFCLVGFSSIIVRVSNQESDTRYARVEKEIRPFDAFSFFKNKIKNMAERMRAFNERCDHKVSAKVYCRDSRYLSFLPDNSIDLILTSPPYVNAYDYALYHKHRLYWLGFDPKKLKGREIGAHSKFSKKEKVETELENFQNDMKKAFEENYRVLKKTGYCCVVVGNTTLWGQEIRTNEIFWKIAKGCDFKLRKDFVRSIDIKKIGFNPKFGRRRNEHIIIFEKK